MNKSKETSEPAFNFKYSFMLNLVPVPSMFYSEHYLISQ